MRSEQVVRALIMNLGDLLRETLGLIVMRFGTTSVPGTRQGVRGASPLDGAVAARGRRGVRLARCRPFLRRDLDLDTCAREVSG